MMIIIIAFTIIINIISIITFMVIIIIMVIIGISHVLFPSVLPNNLAWLIYLTNYYSLRPKAEWAIDSEAIIARRIIAGVPGEKP